MADKERFVPNVLQFKSVRGAFVHLDKPTVRKGKDGQPKGKEKYRMEVLFDPSNKEHSATIKEIKEESVRALNHRFGEGKFTVQMLETQSFPNFYLPWGYGNDLPKLGKKLYDGYKDMFYLKLADENRPNVAAWRDGKAVTVVPGDKDFPYGGCYVAGTTTLYSYDNESRGVGANLRTIVFQRPGSAFGGGHVDPQQEYEALGDLGGGGAVADPFAGTSNPASDPFAI